MQILNEKENWPCHPKIAIDMDRFTANTDVMTHAIPYFSLYSHSIHIYPKNVQTTKPFGCYVTI